MHAVVHLVDWLGEVHVVDFVGARLPDVFVRDGRVFMHDPHSRHLAPTFAEVSSLHVSGESAVVGDPLELLVMHLGGRALRGWLGERCEARPGDDAVAVLYGGGVHTGAALLLRAVRHVPELAHVTTATTMVLERGPALCFVADQNVGAREGLRRFRQHAPVPALLERQLFNLEADYDAGQCATFVRWLRDGVEHGQE